MIKKIFLQLLFCFAMASGLLAQKTISGKVVDEDNEPLVGVNVVIKGTTNGTVTNIDGEFSLLTTPGATLVISFLGYISEEVLVEDQTNIEVYLVPDLMSLKEVVVTALGIKRSQKSLTYATQQVGGDDLTGVPTSNMMNALSGKAAGVSISPGSSGVGGSTKVILRGYTSVQGNNQPLYVVDGVPMQNYISRQAEGGNGFGGDIDAGDGISNMNPEDIESINILKGASAAALYGSQAANGVIIITTKSGKEGKTSVNFSSSFQVDKANVLYEWQDRYGASGNTSWGELSETGFNNNNGKDLYQTGTNLTNTLTMSGGTEKAKNYLSFSNTIASGIVPTNDLTKYNFTARNTTKFFNDYLELDSKINLMNQKMENSPSAPGSYFNPIYAAYLMPVSDDLLAYEDNYTVYDLNRNMDTQNWSYLDAHQNPYWLFNKVPTVAERSRVIANLAATIKITDDLNIKFRGNVDRSYDTFERKAYAGTRTVLSHLNGRYQFSNVRNTQMYGDVLLSYNKNWEKLSVSSTIGSSISDVTLDDKEADSGNKGLNVPNLFSFINMTDGGAVRKHNIEQSQLRSFFGTVSLGYGNFVYVDFTARRDKSSTLPVQNNEYFYPSVGTSILLKEILDKFTTVPNAITYAKIRASYSEVGNDIAPYVFRRFNRVNEVGTVIRNIVKPNPDLEPERTKAAEVGLDIRMFNNRASLDFALYNSITDHQYFEVPIDAASGYSTMMVNGGKVRNNGVELTLGITPVQTNVFDYNTTFNLSTNESYVENLPEELVDRDGGFDLSGGDYKLRVQEKGEYGEIWGSGYRRVDGKLVVTIDENGDAKPVIGGQEDERKLGSINPDFKLSWGNSLNYKNFRFSFLIDGSFGGKVLSYTQTAMHRYGVSKETQDARDNNGVDVDAVTVDENGNVTGTFTGQITAQDYYSGIPLVESLYDATNIRLREIALGYSFPESVVGAIGFISDLRLSLVGRNLFFFYIDAPYDPEITQTTSGKSFINSDNFGVPSTRSYGITLNVKF